MMNYGRWIGILLIPAWVCAVLSAKAVPTGFNYIAKLKGTVEVKRSSWKVFQKANLGDSLRAGDLIRVAKGGSATVVCGNLDKPSISEGKEVLLQAVCKSSRRMILYRKEQRTAPTRSGENPLLPYVLNPRNTALLGRKPILRWHDIHVVSYQVTVKSSDFNWSEVVNGTQVIFPGDKLPITPGRHYRVKILAMNGEETAEDDPVVFSFLSNEQVKQVQQDIEQVKQLRLDPDAEVLALGILLQNYQFKDQDDGLKSEAIDLLTSTTKKTMATQSLLGELYQQIGLPDLAKQQYLQALELAKVQKSLEGKTMILVQLNQVYQSLGLPKEALKVLKEAKRDYQLLGDGMQVKVLDQEIDGLEKLVGS